ncbi:MAG: hypothetical protein [Inoviridae sp.]|nr:MAG: hypothetical protein [Inoviridae sp.]
MPGPFQSSPPSQPEASSKSNRSTDPATQSMPAQVRRSELTALASSVSRRSDFPTPLLDKGSPDWLPGWGEAFRFAAEAIKRAPGRTWGRRA